MGRCSHAAGTHQALIGRKEDNTFQTSRAKIYPAGLNKVLGTAMYRFAASLATSGCDKELPDVFAELVEQQVFCEDVIQPDYHGAN